MYYYPPMHTDDDMGFNIFIIIISVLIYMIWGLKGILCLYGVFILTVIVVTFFPFSLIILYYLIDMAIKQ